jgi:signal transduction histidine kinase
LLDPAVILFILLQAVIVSYRNSIVFEENKVLTGRLVLFNQSLEEKVTARTEDLLHKNEELSKLHQTKTQMLANISHDLGSPIAGIQVYLQLMKEGRIQAGDANVIGLLLEKATHLKRLNHDLFELSKLESKRLSFQREHVLLEDYIDEVYQSFAQDLMHHERVLDLGRTDTQFKGGDGFIHIDKTRIKQVLQNFIDNAVKFSPATMPIIFNCYVAAAEQEGDSVSQAFIEVTDYGFGISAEEMPQVFNRFYKREEGNSGGTGLGLTIAKEIIEQHQGTIGVVSEVDKGSTFFFTLPLLNNVTKGN